MKEYCNNPEAGKLLHAYELSLLSDDEKDLFEAHILECGFCYRELHSFNPRGALLSGSETVKDELERELANASSKKKAKSLFGPNDRSIFQPALLLFLIAILIWPSYVGIKSMLYPPPENGIAPMQKLFLSSLRADGKSIFKGDRNLDGLLVINCPAIEQEIGYRMEIFDSNNKSIFIDPQFRVFDKYKNAEVRFPHRLMIPGRYSVVVTDTGVDPNKELCRYDFWVE